MLVRVSPQKQNEDRKKSASSLYLFRCTSFALPHLKRKNIN